MAEAEGTALDGAAVATRRLVATVKRSNTRGRGRRGCRARRRRRRAAARRRRAIPRAGPASPAVRSAPRLSARLRTSAASAGRSPSTRTESSASRRFGAARARTATVSPPPGAPVRRARSSATDDRRAWFAAREGEQLLDQAHRALPPADSASSAARALASSGEQRSSRSAVAQRGQRASGNSCTASATNARCCD